MVRLLQEPARWADAEYDGFAERELSLAATPVPPAAAKPFLRIFASSAFWGVSGFIVGAIFWHFIGFWGFVSEVVFSNRPRLEDRVVQQAGPHCIELVLDRTTGTVQGTECALEAPQLDESAISVKGDFLINRPRLARGSRAVRLSSGER